MKLNDIINLETLKDWKFWLTLAAGLVSTGALMWFMEASEAIVAVAAVIGGTAGATLRMIVTTAREKAAAELKVRELEDQKTDGKASAKAGQ